MAEKEYIERKAAIEEVESLSVTVTGLQAGKGILSEYAKQYKDSVRKILEDAPAADVVEVRNGRWIPHEHMSRSPYARNYDCSACGNSPIEIGDFCNKCGARMDGVKDG